MSLLLPPYIGPPERLTLVELERVAMCIRLCRLRVDERQMELEEKLKSIGNGYTREAILFCENDMFVLTSSLMKIELMIRHYTPEPKADPPTPKADP